MGYFPLLLGLVIALSLQSTHALSSSEQTLQKVFTDLIIRLKKWIHDNKSELKKGMGAIRKHLALWGMGLRPPSLKKDTTSRWTPDKKGKLMKERTSNNIRPKPIRRPRPSQRPKPSYKPGPTPTGKNPKLPRWMPKTKRLSKSPYDPKYFRSHRRVGRAAVPSGDFQRDYLMVQILEILNGFYSLVHSVDPQNRKAKPETREDLIEENKRDLDKMSTDDLRKLFKQLQANYANVVVDREKNVVTINGKEIKIEDLPDLCCPFG